MPVITLAAIPTASNEVAAAFRELTAEYQEVTVQGPYDTSPGYSSCYSPGRLQHDRHHGNGCSRMSEHNGKRSINSIYSAQYPQSILFPSNSTGVTDGQ
ncbi:MAG: hypothetical protein LC539_13095, partial [Candidatus Thiodiazotropha sp.]|nr:hypothetical protein [Candidatus Thiodiazotropha sp.]